MFYEFRKESEFSALYWFPLHFLCVICILIFNMLRTLCKLIINYNDHENDVKN